MLRIPIMILNKQIIISEGIDSFVNNENISPTETDAAIGPNSSTELLSDKIFSDKIN